MKSRSSREILLWNHQRGCCSHQLLYITVQTAKRETQSSSVRAGKPAAATAGSLDFWRRHSRSPDGWDGAPHTPWCSSGSNLTWFPSRCAHFHCIVFFPNLRDSLRNAPWAFFSFLLFGSELCRCGASVRPKWRPQAVKAQRGTQRHVGNVFVTEFK